MRAREREIRAVVTQKSCDDGGDPPVGCGPGGRRIAEEGGFDVVVLGHRWARTGTDRKGSEKEARRGTDSVVDSWRMIYS